MTTQIRTALLAGFFSFGLLVGSQAQEKYEYAVISYNTFSQVLAISINGKEHKKILIPNTEKSSNVDVSPALKEVVKMSEIGWETYNSNGSSTDASMTYFFFLRKKAG